MTNIENPLFDPPPREVPLPSAPLVRVVAQLRFPTIMSLGNQEYVAPFQEAIRGNYPVLRPEQAIILGPPGMSPPPVTKEVVWRFYDVSGDWRVSLAPDFVALETVAYTSREDFLGKLRELVAALHARADLKLIDRAGLRYIDRVVGVANTELTSLVRPEMLGTAGTTMMSNLELSMSEALFNLPEAKLLARWGLLPPNHTVDPAAIEPVDKPSWVLDLDMFSSGSFPFELDDLMVRIASYAERAYTFFRWSVTDDFLRRFGGQL